MRKTTLLFDLDGTLLPMDQDEFIALYFEGVRRWFGDRYVFAVLSKTIWAGTAAMVANDGAETNETVFWRAVAARMGIQKAEIEPEFQHFYREGFEVARGATQASEDIRRLVHDLRQRGCTLVAATNPVFPRIAQRQRLRWAGFDPDDFRLITTYEDMHHAKPGLGYYREILEKLGVCPEECLMVGNDNQEDMCAEAVGIDGYLITDCLINRDGAPITCTWHGSFAEFAEKIKELL